MDTAQAPSARTESWNLAIFSAQNNTSGGSSDTEANALTVMACPPGVVTTTIPLANWPAARRKEAWPASVPGSRPASLTGARPASVPGSRPASVPGSRPASVPGSRPTSLTGGAPRDRGPAP